MVKHYLPEQAAQAMSAYSDWAPQQFDEAAAGITSEQCGAQQPAAAAAAEAEAAAATAAEGAASSNEQAGAGFVYDGNSGAIVPSTLCCACMHVCFVQRLALSVHAASALPRVLGK